MSSRPHLRAAFPYFSTKSTIFSTKMYCSQNVHYFFKIRSRILPPRVVSYICRQEVTKKILSFPYSLLKATPAVRKAEPNSGCCFSSFWSVSGASAQAIPSLQPPGKEFFEWLHSCVQLLPCGDGSNVTQIQLRCNGLTEGYAIHHDNGNGPYTCDYLCLVDYLNKSAPPATATSACIPAA